ANPTFQCCRKVPQPGVASIGWRNDDVQMVGHQNSGEHGPVLKLSDCGFESSKGAFVRQNRLAMRDTNRNEVDNSLFPGQPDRNPSDDPSEKVGRRSARPTTFFHALM